MANPFTDDDGRVHAFAIAGDGSLTELAGSPVTAGTSPSGVALAPDGGHLYVGNYNSNDVSGYAIGTDGNSDRARLFALPHRR